MSLFVGEHLFLVAPRDLVVTCSVPLPVPVSLETERERRRWERRQRKTRLQSNNKDKEHGDLPPPLKHTVVSIKLSFHKGDDVEEKINSFCSLEDIPESMRLSMLCCVQNVLQHMTRKQAEKLHDSATLQKLVKKAEKDCVTVGEEDDMLRMLDDGIPDYDRAECTPVSLAWEDRFKHTEVGQPLYSLAGETNTNQVGDTAAASTKSISEAAGNYKDDRQSISVNDVRLDVAYRSILNIGGEYARNLFHRERLDALALGKAFKQMDSALTKLQKQQSVEMDEILHEMDKEKKEEPLMADDTGSSGQKSSMSSDQSSAADGGSAADDSGHNKDENEGVSKSNDEDVEEAMSVFDHQSNTDRISQLVNRHVQDTQTLEKRWMEEINKLKRKQKENYRQFVKSLYLNEIVGSGLVPVGHEKVGDGLFSDLFRESTRTSYPSFLYNPLRVKDTTILPVTNQVSTSQHKQFDDILSHETWLGSGQQKSSFHVSLTVGDVVELCAKSFSDKEFKVSLECAESLYSNHMSAMILPHNTSSLADIGGVGASPRVKRFIKACDRATEYHFLPFHAQMRHVKILAAQPNQNQQKHALKTGNFFLTTHSNLLSVHLVFHLIDSQANKSENIAYEHGKNPVLDGIRQIILLANRSGVQSLAIPLVFSESRRVGTLKSSQTVDPDIARQVESIVRCVRSCLSEITTDMDSSLTHIRFMIPDMKNHKYDSSQEHPLHRVAKNAFANVFHL